jgi:hypothetical protein
VEARVKAIEYESKGLKCDAAGCDYTDPSATFEEYEKYLNAPCPKCGAPLLTEADYHACKAMRAAVDWINSLVPGDFAETEDVQRIKVEMDGSGIPKFVAKDGAR